MSERTPCDTVRGRLLDGDVSLELGHAEKDPEGRTQRIRLSDRIALTPAAARRLAISLEEALARGHFDTIAPEETVPDRVTPRGRTPVHAPPSSEVEVSTRLMQAVAQLDVPYQHERSMRLAPGTIDGNRFLLTCKLGDLGRDRYGKVMAVVDPVGFPVALRAAVRDELEAAACVHFGFEAHDGRATCKLYLEQALDFERLRTGPSEPILLHHAYKWQPGDGHCIETRYLWHPNLDRQALVGQIEAVCDRVRNAHGAAFARNALAIALRNTDARKLAYLAVTEGDNPRDSFDLNFYEAGLPIEALEQDLFALRAAFSIPADRFQALYDQIRSRQLGHIASGIHRDGREFVTIYYGLAGYPRFNASLG